MISCNYIRVLFFLILVSISCKSLGQEKNDIPKWNVDFDLAYQICGNINDFIVPSFAFNYNRHSIALGPKLTIPFYRAEKPFGAILSYKIFPNKRDNKFNFFFSLNVDYYKYHEVQLLLIGINNTYFHPKDHIFWEYTIGYGFQYAPTRILYIRFDASAGKMTQWDTYYDKEKNKFTEFGFNLQLSLGYRIFKNKIN